MSDITDKRDAEDAILGGQADAEEFMRDFVIEWNMGEIMEKLKVAWMLMSDEDKQRLEEQDPDAYQLVIETLGR